MGRTGLLDARVAMSAFFVAARAVHYASTLLLFGELVFAFAVARHVAPAARGAAAGHRRNLHGQLVVIVGLAIAASLVSGIAWLAAVAGVMSGLPLDQALNRETLALVQDTAFGRVWTVRLVLIAALCGALVTIRRSTSERLRSHLSVGALVLAAAYVAALAFAGHAAGGQDRVVQIVFDGLHLLSAGAWIGALPGLVLFLDGTRPLDDAVRVTRRFSTLALGSVGVLVVSGLVNAWYLVGDAAALVGTDYGRLLLAKLALFGTMATLAMANRWYLIPRITANDGAALQSLRRNAILETAGGIAVVTVVGALGITVPAAHGTPMWPFSRTLSWQAAEQAAWVGAVLGAVGVVAFAAAVTVLAGLRSHRPAYWLAGLAAMAAAALTWIWLLAVPAHPTTYVASPVRYATDTIVRGAGLYARHCSGCHGAAGRLDTASSSAPPLASAPRIDYDKYRYPGDLYWVIAHGIPGTAMPEFAPRLPEDDIWALIQFLRARSESDAAMTLTDRVDPRRPIVAPDFTFEVAGQPQQSLRQLAGRRSTRGAALVVLYTLPASRQRLARLAADRDAFARAGARVIVLPLAASPTSAGRNGEDGEVSHALARPDVAATYAMFARRRTDADSDAPAHVELLIDRQGYLRARWIGVPDAAPNQTTDVLGQIDALNREPDEPATMAGH